MLARRISIFSCAFILAGFSTAFAQQCQLGSYSADGNEPCNPCPPGSYSNVQGSTQCTPCSPGTFNPNFGGFVCSNCQSGYFSANPGSALCDPCPADTYADQNGSSACLPCQPGYTSPPASASCSPAAVPSVSEWGLAILALTGLIAGTMLFDARRKPVTAPASLKRR
jgi:hypothetical protein